MPLEDYGVLVGRPIASKLGAGQSPHYQVHMVDDTTEYRIAINVKSKLFPSELLYQVIDDYRHPVTELVSGLGAGFHQLPSKPDSGAFDYIRGNLFNRVDMRPLPHDVPGPDNDLNEKIDAYVGRAIQDERATVYAFGERWGPEPRTTDKHFGFLPGNGIHDIHMNQGNSARFRRDDGVWQDGGMLIHFPAIAEDGGRVVFPEQWVAIFLAFQSQCWHTDDTTGHCLVEPVDPSEPGAGDGRLRIVAARVNPEGHDPGRERVILVNSTPDEIDLAGWAIADRNKKRSLLAGPKVDGGAAVTVALDGEGAQLGNKGGIITLLDPEGLKVDGVSYTREQARRPGWTLVF